MEEIRMLDMELKAGNGDTQSQYNLGNDKICAGGAENLKIAAYWYGEAANGGHSAAKLQLSLLYKDFDQEDKENIPQFYYILQSIQSGTHFTLHEIAEAKVRYISFLLFIFKDSIISISISL